MDFKIKREIIPMEIDKDKPAQILDSAQNTVEPSTILEQHKTGKKRGRKPKNENAAPVDAMAQPATDPKIIEESVKTIVKATDGLLVNKIAVEAFKLTGDEKYARSLADGAGMRVEELEIIGTLTAACALKYGIVGRHGEAIMLGFVLIGYSTRMWLCMRELKAIRIEIAKRQPPSENKH